MYKPIELMQQFFIDWSAGKGFRTGEKERSRIRACQRDAERLNIRTGSRERNCHAGQREVDRAPQPDFSIRLTAVDLRGGEELQEVRHRSR